MTLSGVLLLQALEALLQLILEGVAHGREDDVLVGLERLAGRAGAAPAAADEADPERVVVLPGKEFPGKMAGAARALPTRAEVLRKSRRVVGCWMAYSY